ncbi:MAG: class I SAM-dependent methyltransferase [Candidatus Nanoarchaeia archaeon]|nr:class I SAM-dependent methyltransferase [Candidatus Nanoarchaeia archaeon]
MKKLRWGSDPYFFGPRNYFRQNLLVKYLSKKNKKVLDAGCGNGSLSLKLARIGYDVVGIDITKENINFAKSVKKSVGIENLNFFQMSLTDIKFKKNSFDAVVSGEVLEHIKDDGKAVKELNRVLKMKGQCIVSVPQNQRLWSKEDEWVGHIRRYSRKRIVMLMEKNGFRIERIRSVGFPLVRAYFCFFKSVVLNKKIKQDKKASKNMLLIFASKIVSYIFFFDLIFSRLDKGNWLILSARKIKDVE